MENLILGRTNSQEKGSKSGKELIVSEEQKESTRGICSVQERGGEGGDLGAG